MNVGGKFGVSVPSFAISQGTIDPRLLQEEFGGVLSLFVPPPATGEEPNIVQRIADNSVRVASGSIIISGKGRFDQSGFGFQQPLEIQIKPTDLTVADELGTVQTVHVPPMSVVVSATGSVSDRNVATVKNLTLTTMVGTQPSPLLDLEFSSDVTVGGSGSISAPRIQLRKCQADLAGLQSAFGPLLPLVIPAPAAAATQPSIAQAIAQNVLVCTSGKLTASMVGSYDGTTFTISQPLTVSIADFSLQQSGGGPSSAPINDQTLAAAIGGSVSMSDGNIHADLQTMSLQIGDLLKIQGDPQSPLNVTLSPTGTLAASGTVRLAGADLPKLLKLAAMVLPPQQMASLNQLSSGNVSGTINLKPAAGATAVSADVSVNALTVGRILNNEMVHLVAGATLAGDMSSIHDASVEIDTSFARKISIAGGQIVLQARRGGRLAPVGLLDEVQSAHTEVDDLDLAKVDALVNLLFAQAAAPAPGEKVIVIVPPPQVTSGTATLKADIFRSGNTTTANISDVLIHNLAVKRGNNRVAWSNDITAQMSVDMETREDSTGQMPLMDQLAKASVTSLSVDSGIGTTVGLAGEKPIVVSNLRDPANMSVQGGISIDGEIAPAARMAEAFSGANANSYPYGGHFHLDESMSKVASQPRLHISGGGAITKFTVLGQPPAGGGPARSRSPKTRFPSAIRWISISRRFPSSSIAPIPSQFRWNPPGLWVSR